MFLKTKDVGCTPLISYAKGSCEYKPEFWHEWVKAQEWYNMNKKYVLVETSTEDGYPYFTVHEVLA